MGPEGRIKDDTQVSAFSSGRVVMIRNMDCWCQGKEDGSNFGHIEFEVLVGNDQWAEPRAHESNLV